MTSPLGIIGSGAMGDTLARLAVAAGLNVMISNSRGPETLKDLVQDLGPLARAGSVADVAREADIVIAAIPLIAYKQLPADTLAGKIVIDLTNYYPQRDGQIAVLDENASTASELVQAHLASSFVVKTFASIAFATLGNGARPKGDPERSTLPVHGDDAAAKARVMDLLDTLGYDALDDGRLADSWRAEPGTPIYVNPYMTEWPAEPMTVDQLFAWLRAAPVIPMSQQRAADLLASAARGPAGGRFPETI
ncbi:NAD(P)-binding domain-containing protein [Arthrobacter sp. MSA 4-2]|uniref:NADPH-dependent F420 reductase n=1 Tax=Arthrobacter sp. MSA 4-2 TaxID=2794349 RepID=UPI0027DCC9A6|nr:NAD(P)-binding domain-containing protein [Arthrobacter sp. MSA 4-2]